MPTTIRADVSDDGKRINVECNVVERDLVMQVPGARYNKETGIVHTPCTFASCKQLRGILGERLEIGDSLYKWAVAEIQDRIDPCMILRQATKVSDPGGLCEGLYPFQQAGTHFLIAAQQAILADEVGSGKTIQAIAAARAINALPVLVICPNSVKRSWEKEIEKWWPGTPTYVVDGDKKKRAKTILDCGDRPGFCIINYESVRLHSRLSGYGSMALSAEEKRPKELNQVPWSLMIVDEAHRCSNPTSKQTRAIWKISETVPLRWAMTGTPLTNKPDSLWPLLHFINPDEWPSKTAFIQRYCDWVNNYWGQGITVTGLNEANKEEFFSIFDPRFRRMPKAVILPDLPPIQMIRRYIDMSPEQARGYRTMARDMVAVDENGELIIAVNPISKLTRTIQYSSASIHKTDEDKIRLTDPSNKLDALMDDLDDYLAAEESVVVFAVHRQLIEMAELRLQDKKISYSVIKGGQSSTERQEMVDRFQEGEVPVCLAVIAAGGTGLNLHRARIAIFLQRPWSSIDYQQAMGRVHRIGSEVHDSVLIISYVSPGTVEIGQLAVLEGKAQSLEEIVRDKESITRLLNGDSLEGDKVE